MRQTYFWVSDVLVPRLPILSNLQLLLGLVHHAEQLGAAFMEHAGHRVGSAVLNVLATSDNFVGQHHRLIGKVLYLVILVNGPMHVSATYFVQRVGFHLRELPLHANYIGQVAQPWLVPARLLHAPVIVLSHTGKMGELPRIGEFDIGQVRCRQSFIVAAVDRLDLVFLQSRFHV